MPLQNFYRGVNEFWRDCDKQAARRLRIEQQGAIFFGNAGCERDAIAEEIEIIIQATGDHALTSRVESSGKNRDGFVLNLNRSWENSLLRFTQRHLTGVTEYAETGDIGNRVNCSAVCICGEFLERFGSGAIQLAHGSDCGIETHFPRTLPFERSGNQARTDRLSEQNDIIYLRADIPPNFLRVDGPRYSVAELDVVVADGVAADYRAVRLFHFIEAAANNLLEDCRIAFFGKANDGESGDGLAAHSIDIAERIGGGNLAKREWVIYDWCEKIHCLYKREIVVD